ncbi:hypothetical protein FOL47_010124 [Perkinsus chesapeaki]|uniref:Uncharacterized protein n=1 Tax=Perkinsus chesapeaki TaxID=330153 RepID=A0A7J6MQF5_PERCH|nr:hypothetical protein FOL47_010124 [Perkinsus chesapeaki]
MRFPVPTYACASFAVITVNAAVALALWGKLHLNALDASVGATTNLLAVVIARNEHFVNLLFTVFVNRAKKLPLGIRRRFANIYCCYGGIHSGCAIAALVWYLVFTIEITLPNMKSGIIIDPLVLMSWLSMSLLILIVFFALPCVRSLHHNWFECVHRYSAWTLLIILVAQLVLTSIKENPSHALADPRIWEAGLLILLVIYPWLHLRKRNVKSFRLSSHALLLNFDYSDVSFGQAVRISDSPLRETHAFAVIPNIRSTVQNMSDEEAKLWHVDKKGFSVIISRAGDWTSRMIDHPPTRLWTRGVPQYGVLRVVSLFQPCIVMATGSGIGPCLSIFVQQPGHSTVIDTLLRVDPLAIIHDTKASGRPDLVEIATDLWESDNFEAVVFISNKETGAAVKTAIHQHRWIVGYADMSLHE